MYVEDIAQLNQGSRKAMDVAGALAMCGGKELGKLILMGRAADDWPAIYKLRDAVAQSLAAVFPDHYIGVANVIAREVVFVNHCDHCNGSGKVVKVYDSDGVNVQLQEITCGECEGRGWHWYSRRSRSDLSGISRYKWRIFRYDYVVEKYVKELEKLVGDVEKSFRHQ